MPALFHCFPPCEKSFSTDKALNAHISNKPGCFERYSQFLLSLIPSHLGTEDVEHGVDPESPVAYTPPRDLIGTFDNLSLLESERPWTGQQARMIEPQPDDPTVSIEVYPDAGTILRQAQAPYERVQAILEQDGRDNIYYPFASQTEWGLAVFLHNNLTLSEIDKFLQLRFVRNFIDTAFT